MTKGKHSVMTVDSVVRQELVLTGRRITVRGFLRFGDDSRNLWHSKGVLQKVSAGYVSPDDPSWDRCLSLYHTVNVRQKLLTLDNRYVAISGQLVRLKRSDGDVSTSLCSELGIRVDSITSF